MKEILKRAFFNGKVRKLTTNITFLNEFASVRNMSTMPLKEVLEDFEDVEDIENEEEGIKKALSLRVEGMIRRRSKKPGLE